MPKYKLTTDKSGLTKAKITTEVTKLEKDPNNPDQLLGIETTTVENIHVCDQNESGKTQIFDFYHDSDISNDDLGIYELDIIEGATKIRFYAPQSLGSRIVDAGHCANIVNKK